MAFWGGWLDQGMKMCRDLKIQSQANKSKAKYEIGNFCTQYGLPSIIPKRKSKHRGEEPSEKSHKKKTASKHYRKQKFKTDDFYKKGRSSSTGKFIPKASRKCFTSLYVHNIFHVTFFLRWYYFLGYTYSLLLTVL